MGCIYRPTYRSRKDGSKKRSAKYWIRYYANGQYVSEATGTKDLAEAKRRVGGRVCLIGGFDQYHHLLGCSEAETRAAVRRCFEAAGEGGGFILSPSDHFFDADLSLIAAYAEEASHCTYWGGERRVD